MKINSVKLNNVFKWIFACLFALFIVGVLAVNLLFPLRFSGTVNRYSDEYGVDKQLIYSVIWTESKFDKDAVSQVGAAGLMQLMPKTAEWCCLMISEKYEYERLFDPDFNIKLGTYYLSYLIGKYGEDDAITAYNAGEGNFNRWDGEVKFDETKDYIKRVRLVKKIYSFKIK